MFRALAADRMFAEKGSRVATMRWFAWFGGVKELLKKWHVLLLTLTFLGCTEGWFKKDGYLPVFGSNFNDASGNTSAEPDSAARSKDADRVLDSRTRLGQTLKMVATFLGDEKQWRRVRTLFVVGRPVSATSFTEQKNFHEVSKTLSTYHGYATGKYGYVFKRLAAQLCDLSVLEEAGFELDHHLVWGPRLTNRKLSKKEHQDTPVAQNTMLEEERYHAQEFFSLTVGLLRHRGQSLAMYTDSLPGMLAGLLKASSAQATLTKLSQFWNAALEAENLAANHNNAAMRKLLSVILPLEWVVIRELLMTLAQCEFKEVPLPVSLAVESIFGGMGQSACIEDCIGKAKDILRDSKNSRISDVKPFHQAYVSQVVSLYGREEIQSNVDEKSAAKDKLVSSDYSCLGSEPSIESKDLEEITGKPVWTTTHAAGMTLIPGAILWLTKCGTSKSWEASEPWRTTFFLEETVIQHKTTMKFFLVLSSNQYVMQTWPLTCKEQDAREISTKTHPQ